MIAELTNRIAILERGRPSMAALVIASFAHGAGGLPNNVLTTITYDGVVTNTGGLWSAGSTDRLTAPVAGAYAATGNLQINATGSTGSRDLRLMQFFAAGGSTVRAEGLVVSSDIYYATTSSIFTMDQGDYVSLRGFQVSGGAGNYEGSLSLIRLGA